MNLPFGKILLKRFKCFFNMSVRLSKMALELQGNVYGLEIGKEEQEEEQEEEEEGNNKFI